MQETLYNYFNRVATYEWWRVSIELILIFFVVYWAVSFLEGTRGERLFRGVIFILIAGVLTLNMVGKKYHFERLEYLYKGFLIAVLIIAVAAFQPEIRRALMRIGQPRFLAGPSQIAGTVEEIIKAVFELSAEGTGAIIVIEGRIALGEFIETGVRLDARVTTELIKTVFHPGTALHDMAVIIRGDRMVSANVQLPLAEAGSVKGAELGSRHRAAIGITTGSDSTCLVVSEETGTISFAEAGKLTRRVSQAQLRKHLTSAMGQSVPLYGRLWRSTGTESS